MQSKEPEILQSMVLHFGNKQFLRHQAQGFEQFPLHVFYDKGEAELLKTVEVILVDQVPSTTNVVNSHVIYRFKTDDDKSLLLKGGIAPHGNEEDLNNILSKDCTMLYSLHIRDQRR